MSQHAKGLVITALAMLVITPDALLIRLIDTDPWTLAFWRGVLSAVGLLVALAVIYRGRFLAAMIAPGIPGLWIGTLFGVAAVAFVWAITHTTAANTLLILATGSMFGAAFSWWLLREPLPMRTALAMVGSAVGVVIIVGGDIGGGSLDGDLSALALAAICGLTYTLIRKHAVTDMVPTAAFAGIVTAVIAALVSVPVAVPSGDLGWLLVMGLVMLPLGFGLQFIGARYIPAPEVSLLFLLEAVIGPLLVWAVVHEYPGETTFIGGAVILMTLALHAAWSLRGLR
ncbi:MAG: hypothetical protein CMM46_16815 [Rhodospirillaceae bacterium]|nr:hypothetical protein [Rhodospirillaceae bacterium]